MLVMAQHKVGGAGHFKGRKQTAGGEDADYMGSLLLRPLVAY